MELAIRRLYEAFRPYRLGDDFSGCPCCVSEADCLALAAIPLRELTVADVQRYSFKALSTWGETRHFKHFLPRLLELAFVDLLAFDFPEVLLGKLKHAKWRDWPEDERTAVQDFLDRLWLKQLHSTGAFPCDGRVEIALGGLAEACDSVAPYLATWATQTLVLPAMHLAQFVTNHSDSVVMKGTVPLWGEPSTAGVVCAKWLASDDVLAVLTAFREPVAAQFPFTFSLIDCVRGVMAGD